jgi:hypothetical protein
MSGGYIYNNPAGIIIHSYNQTPALWIIDGPAFSSPAIGTEYIIYNGNVSHGFIRSYTPSVVLQISGQKSDLNNKDVGLSANCKCVATKVSSEIWVIQGDGLSYYNYDIIVQ